MAKASREARNTRVGNMLRIGGVVATGFLIYGFTALAAHQSVVDHKKLARSENMKVSDRIESVCEGQLAIGNNKYAQECVDFFLARHDEGRAANLALNAKDKQLMQQVLNRIVIESINGERPDKD